MANAALGAAYARKAKFLASRYAATQVTRRGSVLSVGTKSLEKRERDLLLEGGVNAAAADVRIFVFAASDVAASAQGAFAPDPPGEVYLWHGVPYEVIFSAPVDFGGTTAQMRAICFIQPQPDIATVETASDLKDGAPVTPGVRKSYRPPDNQG